MIVEDEYLCARGRCGLGRPAEFGKEVTGDSEVDKEVKREEERKYSRRQLGSNADQYVEPEPELNSDGMYQSQAVHCTRTLSLFCYLTGEVEPEPEVNLSTFLEKQRSSDLPARSTPLVEVDHAEDVDLTLAHISSRPAVSQSKKGQVKQINWDEQLEDLNREKAAAEAAQGVCCIAAL